MFRYTASSIENFILDDGAANVLIGCVNHTLLNASILTRIQVLHAAFVPYQIDPAKLRYRG
jgi:dethiobiotin synthetase